MTSPYTRPVFSAFRFDHELSMCLCPESAKDCDNAGINWDLAA